MLMLLWRTPGLCGEQSDFDNSPWLTASYFIQTVNNENQIWTASIAMLLIEYLKFKSRFHWSLSNLIAFLRCNLFTYRELWEWVDNPNDVLPENPIPVQHLLPFIGIGQQCYLFSIVTVELRHSVFGSALANGWHKGVIRKSFPSPV
jgi:hypothetical protein